jgi:hypothetical protein
VTAAFLAAALEVILLAVHFLELQALRNSFEVPSFRCTALTVSAALANLLSAAAQTAALWAVGRRRPSLRLARLGQWTAAVYLIIVLARIVLQPSVVLPDRYPYVLLEGSNLLLAFAFASLGLALRSGSHGEQEWASRGLLVLSFLGILGFIWVPAGLPGGQPILWLVAVVVAIRVATWVIVALWLRHNPSPAG